MSSTGEPLISRVIDENNASILDRYQIVEDDFPTEGERQTFRFIRAYTAQNGGQMPSYATVTAECEHFTYIPGVTDSYEYLVRKLKENAGKRALAGLFNGQQDEKTGKFTPSAIAAKFDELSPEDFKIWLLSEMDRVTMGTRYEQTFGFDVKTDAQRFLDEYYARKEGRSVRTWKSCFPSINKIIGGYQSANMYTWYGRSGRGKSVIVQADGAIEPAFQGATVLVWALEMSTYEWLARGFSMISARLGIVNATINGVTYPAGFENRALRTGQLSDEFEAEFKRFLAQMNDIIPGRIIVRGVNDSDFHDRSLRQLEADTLQTGAQVVVVDPFYYLDYEANTSRKTGGDAEATSKKLRQLAGRLDIVVHAITQAEEDENEKDDEGVREIRVPQRSGIKKTTQLLEDAAATFGIDSLWQDGRGAIELRKGRSGGEDERVELLYLPQYGIVREMAAAANPAQFSGAF